MTPFPQLRGGAPRLGARAFRGTSGRTGSKKGAPAGRRRRLGRCRGVGHRDRNRARRTGDRRQLHPRDRRRLHRGTVGPRLDGVAPRARDDRRRHDVEGARDARADRPPPRAVGARPRMRTRGLPRGGLDPASRLGGPEARRQRADHATTAPRARDAAPPARARPPLRPPGGRPPRPSRSTPPVRRPTLPTGVTAGDPRATGCTEPRWPFRCSSPAPADLPPLCRLARRRCCRPRARDVRGHFSLSAILGDAQRPPPVVRASTRGDPRGGEWDQSGRWTIRWRVALRRLGRRSPSTAVTTAPWTGLERRASDWLGLGTGSTSPWELCPGR